MNVLDNYTNNIIDLSKILINIIIVMFLIDVFLTMLIKNNFRFTKLFNVLERCGGALATHDTCRTDPESKWTSPWSAPSNM